VRDQGKQRLANTIPSGNLGVLCWILLLFDVQVKRFHEYSASTWPPWQMSSRTCACRNGEEYLPAAHLQIFGGKAAPRATPWPKLIIPP